MHEQVMCYAQSSSVEKAWARRAGRHCELSSFASVNAAALGWMALAVVMLLLGAAVIFFFAVMSAASDAKSHCVVLCIAVLIASASALRYSVLRARFQRLMAAGEDCSHG